VIGEVQAGAWREAIHFEESERRKMDLPPDPDYPGIKRYALRNVGESMNRECADGGYWVFVRLEDLTGIGPQPGQFVIVQRSRYGGQEFEATCKRLEIRDGKPWLCPYSYDPSFEPIPFTGLKSDEIQVIGIVTDVINKPGRRR
jgi:SOS-response transcriptional repressor LexA